MNILFDQMDESGFKPLSGVYSQDAWNVQIHYGESKLLQLYEYSVPFCFTVEECLASENRFIIYQFSPRAVLKNERQLNTFPNYAHRPLHQHNGFELMFVLSGSVHHRVETHNFVYQPGQCCLMNRNVRHVEDFSSDFEAVFLEIMPDFAMEICDRDIYYLPDGTLKHRDTAIYRMFRKNREDQENYEKLYLDFLPGIPQDELLSHMVPLLRLMLQETGLKRPGHFNMLQSLMSRLFDDLENAAFFTMSEIRADASSQDYLFAKLTLLLEAKHGRVSRSELEMQLNYNSDYLNRIIKRRTGMNLTEYSQSFYLEDARRMLLETNLTISEIIRRLGFSNHSHFYRIFAEKYGMTPNDYRQAKRNSV